MKSFATFALFAASITSAQVTYNSTTSVFTCPTSNPNGAFCASDSLQGNIIIRCTNGIGQPGNCNDNLSGEFPSGLSYAPCWETSNTSGDAACSKNCVVYGGSGNFNGTFTLPDCTAISSSSSASGTSTSISTASSTSQSITTTKPLSSTTSSVSGTGTSSSTTATVTTISKIGSTITTSTYTTTYCPSSTLSSIISGTGTGSGSGSSGSPAPPSNGTISTGGAGGVSSAGSTPTATPVGPTKSASASSPSFTGGAATIANSAGSVLAAVGLAIAYFL